jgi:F-type H+-transporting ATPase subunit epsilon
VRILLPQEGEQAAAVHGGFVEVANDRVIVLSDVAELAESIDVDRARRARQRAEERLAADADDEDAHAALLRATTRLEVAGATEHA